LSGDFDVDGGIYRPVHLFATDAVCITPLDSASAGVYLTTRALTDEQAQVEVRTLVSNGRAEAASAEVVTEIRDAGGLLVATQRTSLALPAGAAAQAVVQTASIPHPHRWQGRDDPYLYAASVRVLLQGRPVDEVVQPLGLRTAQITEADGFLLNGRPYPIHGVDRHQDLKGHGWAMGPADHERDVQLMLEMGVTAIRLAHYPQSEYFHDLADRSGLLLWNEVPFVNQVSVPGEAPDRLSPESVAFDANLLQQMREMILQRYNHPSVVFWGLYNELNTDQTDATALPVVRRLNALAHALDPQRLTVAASDHLRNTTNFVADRQAYNIYPGWYTPWAGGDLGQLVAQRYAEQGHRIALSEYGAGANPFQHEEGALQRPIANNGAQHPEEWQTYVHERDWAQIQGNPRLWGTFLWAMFDFASDGRNEGSQAGINDKGLVTQDRRTRKDAYYFYQANWSATPMAYLASRRAAQREQAHTAVEVFSNCSTVELFLNGRSLGVVPPDAIHVARWPDVTLVPGKNTVVAIARSHRQEIKDACDWTLAPPPAGKP
jgi:beta-galactosidase